MSSLMPAAGAACFGLTNMGFFLFQVLTTVPLLTLKQAPSVPGDATNHRPEGGISHPAAKGSCSGWRHRAGQIYLALGLTLQKQKRPGSLLDRGASTDSGRRRLACPRIFSPKRFCSSVGR